MLFYHGIFNNAIVFIIFIKIIIALLKISVIMSLDKRKDPIIKCKIRKRGKHMNLTMKDMEKVYRIIERYEQKLDLSIGIELSEYHERYKKVWDELEKRGIDLGFFFWYREMPGDGLYLTGYNPTIERASGVITPGKPPMILAGPESGILAKEVGLDLPTSFVTEFSIPDEYYEGITCEPLPDLIREYVGKDISTIGYMTSYDVMPAKFYDVLCNDISKGAKVIDATDILEELRYEKSESEFKCMKQADMIACAAIRASLAVARVGMRESELAAVCDFVIKALGGNGYGVETMVMSDFRCRSVIGPATNKALKAGEIVQVGCSPSYQGYKGVCRRAFVMGERSDVQNQYFAVMNEGFRLAEIELKNVVENGLSNNLIDLAARNYFDTQSIEGTNMKSCHFYSTCHGTGLTECLEKMVIHPEKEQYYGENVGIMLDLGVYGHPNNAICGGCVESAFFKKGNTLVSLTDVPADVQHLVGADVD